MKKLFIFIFILFLFIPSTLAAEVVSETSSKMSKNKSWPLAPMLITSTTNSDIKAQYGLRLILDPTVHILWQSNPLTVTGTAVDTGKIMAQVTPEYSKDYKSLYIPVKKDFLQGDSITIQGLMVKTYDDGFDYKFMGLDLNADFKVDVSDTAGYSVSLDPKNDLVAPYPVSNPSYKLNSDNSLSLKWSNPPDYDYQKTIVEREGLNKYGFTENTIIDNAFLPDTEFVDLEFKDYSHVVYHFTSVDYEANKGPVVDLKIDSSPVIKNPENSPLPTENPSIPNEQVEKLTKLMDYYLLRYQIHCTPNGIPVAEPSYDCYWPRIDMVYAQQLTGIIKVKDLAIPPQDLTFMTSRRKWSEMRYENDCVKALTPSPYCPSLKGALDRVSYFLDR